MISTINKIDFVIIYIMSLIPYEIIRNVFSFSPWDTWNSILRTCKDFNRLLVITEKGKYYHSIKKTPFILTKPIDVETEELNMVLVKYCPYSIKYIKNQTESLLIQAIKSDHHIMKYSLPHFRDNEGFILKAISIAGCEVFNYASERIINDKDFMFRAITIDGECLKFAPANVSGDKSIIDIVKKYGNSSANVSHVIKHVSKELKRNKELCLEVVKHNGFMLKYINFPCSYDKDVVLEAVKNNGMALKYAEHAFAENKEVVLEAVRNCGEAIRYAQYRAAQKKEIILEAIKTYPRAIDYACPFHTNDKSFILEVSKYCPWAIQNASSSLKDDNDIVSTFVEINGHYLQPASRRLKNNKEIVLKAVRNRGTSLQFASQSLRDDEEVVLEAIKNDPTSIKYASSQLIKKFV